MTTLKAVVVICARVVKSYTTQMTAVIASEAAIGRITTEPGVPLIFLL